MLKNKYYFIIGWVFFFFWCSFIIGYIYHLHYGLNTIFCNFDAAICFLGDNDGGTILKAAKAIIDNKNSFFESWILGIWPPGMLVLGLLYLSVFSKLIPIGLFYITILSAIFATICVTFFRYLVKKKVNLLLMVLLIGVILIIPHMLSWGAWHFIYFSDAFSNLFFIYGVVLLFFAMDNNEIHKYVKAGFAFTMGALFRSHIFLAVLATTLMLVVLLFVQRRKPNATSLKRLTFVLKYTFSVVMLFILAYHIISGGRYCYNKADHIWSLPFIKMDVSFWDDRGMRTARDCDPIRGKEISEALESKEYNKYKDPKYLKWVVILSPLKYPVFYMFHKIPIGLHYYHSVGIPVINWFLLFIFFSLVIRLFCRFKMISEEEFIILFIMIGSALSSFIPSIILHFEERYLILFKLTTLVCFVYEIVINYKRIALFLRKCKTYWSL